MHQERSDRCAACTGSCRRRWWSLAEQRSSACKPCSNRRRRNVPGGFFSPKHRNSHTHSHAAARRRRRRSALSLSRRPPRRRARGLRWSVARQPAAGPTEPRRRRWLTVQRRAFDWDGCGTGGGPVRRWRRRRRVPAASRSTTAATRTASAQQNERGRQRNVGLSSVPALCRPFKLSVPPCLETPCKYVKARPPSRRSFHYLFFFFILCSPRRLFILSFFSPVFSTSVCVRKFFFPLPLPSIIPPPGIITLLENNDNARRSLFSYFVLSLLENTTPSGRLQTPHVNMESVFMRPPPSFLNGFYSRRNTFDSIAATTTRSRPFAHPTHFCRYRCGHVNNILPCRVVYRMIKTRYSFFTHFLFSIDEFSSR